MTSGQVQAVFFDAVGTLIHPDPAAGLVYAEIGRRFGSRYTFPTIASRFAQAFAKEESADRAANLRTSEEREFRRWRNIVAQVLDDVADPEACFLEIYQHFAGTGAWRLAAAAAEVLDHLAGRGLVLGLASNYDQRLRGLARSLPALNRLQHLVISSEVGWRKPAGEFFQAVARSAHLPPERILFVGDDPANDYEGATAAGLGALLLAGVDTYPSFTGPRLAHLRDLPAWLT